jgi:hypothetical protein
VTGRETVEVAHEALLDRWGRLKGWVDKVREQLRDQFLMDDLAEQWRAQGKPRLSGLASGRTLKRFERAGAASELASEYLRASRARRTLGRASAGLGVLVLAAGLAGLIWLDSRGLTVRHPMAAILSTVGMWAPIEPETIRISAEAGHPMRFQMGLASTEEPWMGPVHEVHLARPFGIGKLEVTFAEYDRFALATWRKLPADQGWGREDRPVINVSWEDAAAYAQWLRDETGKRYRLPSEAEWKYAARAGTDTLYWWGEDIKEDGKVWANCNGCGSEWDYKSRPRRRAHSQRTLSASKTRRATSGSGCRTAGTKTTRGRRRTVRPGKRKGAAIAAGVLCAAAPGSPLRWTSARRAAAGPTPTSGTSPSGSVSPRTSDPLCFVLLPFAGVQGACPLVALRAQFSFRGVVANRHLPCPAGD